MTPGRRQPQPEELFVATADLPRGPGHPFYTELNAVLAEDRFDTFIEHLCAPSYKDGGRIGIPPGVGFRMFCVGCFEGLDCQRGIALRCADSFALRAGKKVSDEHWGNPHDPAARIAKMKDGTTHLAYKAEHAVDLVTEAIVVATVTTADRGDNHTCPDALGLAQAALMRSGSDAAIPERSRGTGGGRTSRGV